jgi:hypothetical protein
MTRANVISWPSRTLDEFSSHLPAPLQVAHTFLPLQSSTIVLALQPSSEPGRRYRGPFVG